jgi:hypothetical protein
MLTFLLLVYFPVLFNLAKESKQFILVNILLEKVNHTTILIASAVWPKLFKEHIDFCRNMLGIILYIENQFLNIRDECASTVP